MQTGGSGTWLLQISRQQIHQQLVSAQPRSGPFSPEPRCNDLARQRKQYHVMFQIKLQKLALTAMSLCRPAMEG